MIGGVADVDSEGDVGIDGVGGSGRTAAADFLLGRRDCDDFGGELLAIFVLREPDQGFSNHIGAYFIVEGAGGADAAVNQFKFVIVGGDVTDGDAGEGVFFVRAPMSIQIS